MESMERQMSAGRKAELAEDEVALWSGVVCPGAPLPQFVKLEGKRIAALFELDSLISKDQHDQWDDRSLPALDPDAGQAIAELKAAGIKVIIATHAAPSRAMYCARVAGILPLHHEELEDNAILLAGSQSADPLLPNVGSPLRQVSEAGYEITESGAEVWRELLVFFGSPGAGDLLPADALDYIKNPTHGEVWDWDQFVSLGHFKLRDQALGLEALPDPSIDLSGNWTLRPTDSSEFYPTSIAHVPGRADFTIAAGHNYSFGDQDIPDAATAAGIFQGGWVNFPDPTGLAIWARIVSNGNAMEGTLGQGEPFVGTKDNPTSNSVGSPKRSMLPRINAMRSEEIETEDLLPLLTSPAPVWGSESGVGGAEAEDASAGTVDDEVHEESAIFATLPAESRTGQWDTLFKHEQMVLALLSPKEKATVARQLRRLGYFLVAVGDGGNGGAMMSQCDYGIAPGTALDETRDAASIVVTSDDLQDIVAPILALGRGTTPDSRQYGQGCIPSCFSFLWWTACLPGPKGRTRERMKTEVEENEGLESLG